MRKILDARLSAAESGLASRPARASTPDDACRMREQLADFLARATAGRLTLHLPSAVDIVSGGEGHFHLAPELFLQVSGRTDFLFPNGRVRLGPSEALVMPPRLLHAESVGAAQGEDFCNIVVYAEGIALTSHLAHEAEPGRPGILHLEARRHPQAARIHDWLGDALRLGHGQADDIGAPWASLQARALVAAATAGVLRALDDTEPGAMPEPPLIARVRVLIQNQLGDPQLSVRGLAERSGCTADYLSHLFRQTAGEHLVAHINRQRLERAVHLLRDSRLAGKEIAWACGFATQSYFIRSFRAQFGTTPKAWRQANATAAP